MTSSRRNSKTRRFAGLTVALLWLCLLTAAGARAEEFALVPEASSVTVSTTQAGAHPDLVTSFKLATTPAGLPVERLRDARVTLPPGFWGAPWRLPQCTEEAVNLPGTGCPEHDLVGLMSVELVLPNGEGGTLPAPLYNVRPGSRYAAEFGANLFAFSAFLKTKVRPGDYGLETVSLSIPDTLYQIKGVTVELWGVPADHTNAGDARIPLLTNPAICDTPTTASFAVDSWAHPELVKTGSAELAPFTGCENMGKVRPQLLVAPDGPAQAQPSGYDLDLKAPQPDSPDGIAPPTVRQVKVDLPEGVSISPDAAEGLQTCTEAQLAPGSEAEPDCPEASKVGTVSIVTPALENPLTGTLYVGDPQPGNRYRLFLVAKGQGVMIKLEGEVRPDPETGRLSTVFSENPPLPFSELKVHLKGGPSALLSTPRQCGTYTTSATLTPYGGGADEVATSDFTITGDGQGGACAPPQFRPTVDAGVTNPVAGGSSPFVLRVQRGDLDSELKSISTTLPPGLLAHVGSVPLCSDAQAAAGSCPEASRVGTVVTGAGPGTSPFYIDDGKVFLTEGYKGAPFGLDIVVPAVAGPYDLGDVNVRAALRVDPVTAQATVDADPMPRILEGIPLQVRDVRVLMDRDGFMQSPTSCEPMSIDSTIASYMGDAANVSNRFQLGDCAALGFRPKLSMSFSGPTHRSAHPALRAVLKAREGDANIGKAVVTLPKTEFLENAHIRTICTRVQYAANECPKASIYGYAMAWSPLLDQPLQGPVYLRSSNHQLPDLVASLDGQIHIDLAGRIDSVHQRIRNTFEAVPDAPINKFVLTMQGGKKGLLVNNTELCGAKPRLSVQFTGHNGKHSHSSPLVKTDCRKK